ncbi:hypothetical protein C882_1209 [Caenispirillum salinarum AK4]|uniref:Uncharacterized protein n=1 Tax=Caenispirillum salinarum AK4 TaxID=1238182 RepID=K9HCF3_9PROT|nr:hypothetical protein [Caenispirillum salinarum]EKV28208.1 hypothetical protein C882_1209 [Caenispirillum salinarum AK4]
MPAAPSHHTASLLAAILLAAGLAAGVALWGEWGLLVFYNGGGLGC